jgi:hypothetical protein
VLDRSWMNSFKQINLLNCLKIIFYFSIYLRRRMFALRVALRVALRTPALREPAALRRRPPSIAVALLRRCLRVALRVAALRRRPPAMLLRRLRREAAALFIGAISEGIS